jgi:hypothetical protein
MPDSSYQSKAQWLLSILDEGKRGLETIISENARLREFVAKTEVHLQQLGEGKDPRDERIRDLEAEVTRLAAERDRLLASGPDGAGGGSSEIEEHYNTVSNLFVALAQLSSAAAPAAVVETVRELLLNLVGATSFELYVESPKGGLHSVGLQSFAGRPPAANAEPRIGQAHKAQKTQLFPDPPRAVVPMLLGAKVAAVLVVGELLPHKKELERGDLELLHLLSEHLAPALVRAQAVQRQGKLEEQSLSELVLHER